ncbi:MAG: hypothetical protein Q8L13_18795 [Bradyrhizobium sp.]|uniref:hypothetical protein n=1 Tax=Bradyrhizobium sp. TaxID=376 RepID=UPI002730362C|nr:hypothetical protein [Bradyrhizobium sp.]MDP1868370.1 hypothetical protein [Bradyrhizobium sp.]
MQNATDGGAPGPSGDRNNGHQSIASELVSLIEHVQAGVKQLEAAITRETAPGNQDAAGNVFVLDDVTPRYAKATVALNACHASLGVALHQLLDVRAPRHQTGHFTARDRRPVSLINHG